MGFFDRISRGWALTKASFHVLKLDKEMILYPVLSGIVLLLVAASFLFAGFTLGLFASIAGDQATEATTYVLLVAFYLVSYFVVIYFNTALVSSAMIRFEGRNPTLGDGFRGANARLGKILGWALVAGTVGMLLNVISRSNHPIARLIGRVAGIAWSVVTYFVIPVIVVENLGPIDAIKRSTSVVKRTWGESLTGYVATGAVFFVLGILGFLVLLLLVMTSPALLLPAIILGVLYFIGLGLVSATVSGILNAALYHYAAKGQVPGEFSGQEGLIRDPGFHATGGPPGIAGY